MKEPSVCCRGLRALKIPVSEYAGMAIVGSNGICTGKCGNGICEKSTESNYNCPEDCISN
jgi:hypothetical protein